MNITKGLFSEARPQDTPPGFYPFAKNGIMNKHVGAIENEPGFRKMVAVVPYRPIGIIESDKFTIVVSTNNVNTAIGYFDDVKEVYIPVYNDATLPFKFQFSTDHYVTGQAQRNYKGQVIVALTDKNVDPLLVNMDNPTATKLESLFLFPQALAPALIVTQDNGGSLFPGAYYILVRYTNNDGTETSYLSISDVSLVEGTAGTPTSQSLVISLSGLDITYDNIQLAVISKINNVTRVIQLPEQALSGTTMQQVYTGAEITTDLTLEEVLINPAAYNKVGTMGQLNDALYVGNLEQHDQINMQQWANLVKVNWVSDLISVIPPTKEHTSGQKKSFMHQEVYALYIQYSLTYGGWSKYFPVHGTIPLPADLATATELGQELLDTGGVPKYKVEDTIHSYSTFGFTGEMGVWVNENETYPDTLDYDSSAIGGPNLRGQKVLHHRFPSIRWCKESLYSNDTEYGRSKLDLMGLRISNVIIPGPYQGIITGWRIVYAKRTLANSTVLGQSLLLHAARAANSAVDGDYISTGGNWGAKMDFKNQANDKQLNIDKTTFRFHSFDMLFNQPAVSPTYMSFQLKHSRPNLAYDAMIEDFSISPDSKNGPIVYLIDYALSGTTPTPAPTSKRIRKVGNTSYVPVNLIAGKWKNLQQETTFGGNLTDTREILTDAELSFSNLWVGPDYEQPDKAAQFEFTFLTNLMAIKNDICKPFTSQALASAGQRQIGVSGDFFGGDCFVNDYTFHTYGWNDYDNRGYGAELGGIKVVRRFVCEAVANINLRYEVPGNIYSKWYPHNPLVANDPNNYILPFNRKIDPNQFGYNRDLSSVNEFIFGTIFNPAREDVTKFPFRIHRLGKLSRQDKRRSWKSSLPLDYYEAQKNMGFIVNIDSYMDRLIIHHENALFLTQGKGILEQGLLSITLGTGDIFSTDPQEEQPAKLGYAGTQHDLACVKTPIGYIFLDAKQGQIFLFNGKLALANNGLNTFFRTYLMLKDRNPFMGNGFTVGYDPEYRRFLFTCKNQKISEVVRYDYEETQAYYTTLLIGDVIYKNGRYQRFLGANNTIYDCPSIPLPHGDDKDFIIPETMLVYTRIGTLTGTNYTNFIMDSNLDDGTFYIDAGDGFYLGKQVDFETQSLYIVHMLAVGAGNVVVPFTATVHITDVGNEPPVVKNERIFVEETVTNGTDIYSIIASDPHSLPLTYTLISGNFAGAFTVNSVTGHITVTNAAEVKFAKHPAFTLYINVSNGTTAVTAQIQIWVNSVPGQPTLPGGEPVITIPSTIQNGVVGIIEVEDPNSTDNLIIRTINESNPGVFTVNAVTHEVILNDAGALDPLITPTYTMNLEAVDNTNLSTPFMLTINVNFDPETLIFEPITASCAGTIKHWANIKIKTATDDILTVPNSAFPQYFQNITIPYYPGVPNSIDCGGVNNAYFSELRTVLVQKNDCADTEPGTYGETVKYVVPAGAFVSTVSVAAANALADADIAGNKQVFANTYGNCLR